MEGELTATKTAGHAEASGEVRSNDVAEQRKLEYFLLRYMPNVVRGEFVNIGLVMTENDKAGGFAGVHFTKDWRHARLVDPNVDVEVLEALGREIQARISDDNARADLLQQMMDSWSNLIQTSPLHQILTEDPARELSYLARALVEMPRAVEGVELEPSQRRGRRWIRSEMGNAFRAAGIWDQMMKDVPASPYTNLKDDFTFDFGYTVGNDVRLFHAVSLVDIGQETRMFPLRVAKIRPRMAQMREKRPYFTAVVEDSYDMEAEAVATVLAFMKDEEIRVERVREMARIAETARVELGA